MRSTKAIAILIGICVLGVAIRLHHDVSAVTTAYPGLPMWDMAMHGLDGLRLADHARHGDFLRFVTEILRMGMWPPVFPLLESMVFFVAGREYAVAASFVTVLLALTVAAAFLVGTAMGGRRGLAAGAGTAALLATSPIVAAYGSVVMLEVPGMLLLLACVIAYLRHESVRSRDETTAAPAHGKTILRSASWVAGLTLVLFLCKYNYGLLWIVALLAAECDRGLLRGPASGRSARSARIRAALRVWLPGILHHPARVLLAAYLLFLGAIVVTGGWVVRLGSLKISMRSPANAALGLIWLLAVVALVHPRRNLLRLRGILARLDPLHGRLLTRAALPAIAWFLWPSHCKGFFNFVENRDSGLSLLSGAGLLFYPRAFLADYSPDQSIGLAVLLAGLGGAVLLWLREPRWRIFPAGLVTGLLITTLHRYKDPRFFFTVAPFVWLCATAGCATSAGIAWSSLVRRISRRDTGLLVRRTPAIATVVTLFLSVGSVYWAAIDGIERHTLSNRLRQLSVPAAIRPVLDDIAGDALSCRGSVFAGGWNGFSPALVEWHLRIRRPGLSDESIPRSPKKLVRNLEPQRLLDRIAVDGTIERVLVLELESGTAVWDSSYVAENAWLPPVRQAMSNDPRFHLQSIRRYPDSGYQLWVFEK